MTFRRSLLVAIAGISAFANASAQNKPYFQQFVKYNITVSLDDVKHELNGFETLEYTNNSPDALPFIWMHLWPNGYRENGTALEKQLSRGGDLDFHFTADANRGGIDQLDFKVDGVAAKTEPHPEHIDIIKLVLNQPLQPGQKITITTPFHVRVPNGNFSRMGHDGNEYQITQWYPKPAVYDGNGWNEMPYLNQGEFYSEFGTYDVFITLPKNYVVGATGDLEPNDPERLWMDELAASTVKKLENLNPPYPPKNTPPSAVQTKTLHYHQENVHDFAWFCGKTYNVMKSQVTLPRTNHTVTTWALFNDNHSKVWKKGAEYINDALLYYSKWNGDYPYNHCTAVDGALTAGGGMEYPNITVISAGSSAFQLETVIMHEVGHNWFYGMLGSNERMHPWMDEGLNSYNELRYVETKYPNKYLLGDTVNPNPGAKALDLVRYKQKAQYYQLTNLSCRQHIDQPVELPAEEYLELNYGAIVYSKSAVLFDYLRGYLGDELMDKCMQTYFERWKFKHPQPADFRLVMEEVSGKNLSWLFDDLIPTTKKLDYKIGDVHHNSDGSWAVTVKNTGDVKGPVSICGVKDGNLRGIVWYDGFDGKKVLPFPPSEIDYFVLDYFEDIPEYNRKNNTARTHGLFKRTEPLKIQFAGSLDNPSRTQLYWLPAMGWNMYNGYMLGLAVYNHAAPMKRFEWEAAPMYGFRNKNIAGYAGATLHFHPNFIFDHIDVGATARRFCYSNEPLQDLDFNKVAPEILLKIKKKRAISPLNQEIRLRNIFIWQDNVIGKYQFSPPIYDYTQVKKSFFEAAYRISTKDNQVHPFDVTVKLQQGDTMRKLTFTGNYKLRINKEKAIRFRVFAGTFLDNTNAGPYRFRMSGWRGYQDYLYDHTYLGRSATWEVASNQMTENDGNFKLYTPVGQSAQWLTALNIKADLPFNVKFLNSIKLYGDFGTCGSDGLNTDNFLYNAGIDLRLFGGFADVYFPLLMSADLRDAVDANGWSFVQTIRFELQLEKINPKNLQNLIQF